MAHRLRVDERPDRRRRGGCRRRLGRGRRRGWLRRLPDLQWGRSSRRRRGWRWWSARLSRHGSARGSGPGDCSGKSRGIADRPVTGAWRTAPSAMVFLGEVLRTTGTPNSRVSSSVTSGICELPPTRTTAYRSATSTPASRRARLVVATDPSSQGRISSSNSRRLNWTLRTAPGSSDEICVLTSVDRASFASMHSRRKAISPRATSGSSTSKSWTPSRSSVPLNSASSKSEPPS